MSKIHGRGSLIAVLSLLTLAALPISMAKAGDDVTEDQILKALAPKKPLTRSLSNGPQTQTDPVTAATEGKFVQSLRNRPTRSLSLNEREEIAAIVKDKPKIDLEINFDYNSAEISAKSLPSVQALGRALSNPDLKGSTFIVAGHTDAAGGETYNQDLSERRAELDQAISCRQIRHRRSRPGDRRVRQDQAEGFRQPLGGREPPCPGRQHGKQGHRVQVKGMASSPS